MLMTSGYVRDEDQAQAQGIGIRELILKPVTMDDPGRALDAMFREAAGANGTAKG